MEFSLFTNEGFEFVLRWIHFLSGVAWIGHLYYFNFVQGEFFKEVDAAVKKVAIQKLVPRALWWFRWGAMFTFLSGALILMNRAHNAGMEVFATSWGVFILLGALMGTLMFLNVWLIIWPNQKVVIAAANGENHPDAADRGAKALLASRTNTLFSIPMLFLMGAASHLPVSINPEANFTTLWVVLLLIVGAIELNAIKGKLGPLTTVKGVIHSGLGLAIALYFLIEFMI